MGGRSSRVAIGSAEEKRRRKLIQNEKREEFELQPPTFCVPLPQSLLPWLLKMSKTGSIWRRTKSEFLCLKSNLGLTMRSRPRTLESKWLWPPAKARPLTFLLALLVVFSMFSQGKTQDKSRLQAMSYWKGSAIIVIIAIKLFYLTNCDDIW